MTPHAKVTRRQFLARSGALIGAMSLVDAGGASARSLTTRTATAAAASTSDTVVLGMQTVPPGLDPQKWWNGACDQGTISIFDRLIEWGFVDSDTIMPGLAVAVPTPTNNGRTYTFKLRSGVTFHDGSPLTANDVKYTYERLVSPKLQAQAASLYTGFSLIGISEFLAGKSANIPGIEVVDPLTVAFHLEEPDSAFLGSFANTMAAIVPQSVVERVGETKFNWAPVGTGPYRITSVDLQRGITLERNPHYWQAGLPKAAGVDWQLNVDPQLSALRILQGTQDLMYEPCPAGVILQVRNNPTKEKQLVITPQNEVWFMSVSQRVPQLRSLDARKAIAMAIDKEKLHRVLLGIGSVANGGIFSPLSPYYQPSISYPYDPTTAKALLASAGVKSGFTVKAWSANYWPWTDMAQSVSEDLRAVGISVDYTPMSYNAYVNFTNPGPPGLMFFNWSLTASGGSGIIDSAFTQTAITEGCCNYPHWTYPGFDALAAEAHRDRVSQPDDRVV